MEIISRARWGARYSAGFGPSPLPAKELWLHHSVTIAPDLVWIDADGDGVEDDEERAMRTLEGIGQQRFGGGISYTFAVMPSGRIYEGHGVSRQGAHTGGRNDIARAIVLVGDYSTRGPTDAQKRAVAWLVDHGRRQGWWTVAGLSGGHRQAPNQVATACPGDAALREIPSINRLSADYRAGQTIVEEDDMNIWDLVGFRPNRNQNLFDAVEQIQLNQHAQNAVLASIANDKDVTPDELDRMMNAAVERHAVKTADVVAQLIPAVEEIAERVAQVDNTEQAAEVVRQLARQLAGTTTQEGS
jgi:hypothetical protein